MNNNEIASLRPQLIKLTKYNLWANTKVTEFLSKLEPALLDKKQISSFRTIRKTVYHVWDAEMIWLNRLNGTSFSSWPSEDFNGSDDEAFRHFTEQSAGFVTYTEGCTEESMQNVIHYSSVEGKKYETKICDIILHVMNHSTFHRGQIITMLRNAGFNKLSSTDYITYLRESI